MKFIEYLNQVKVRPGMFMTNGTDLKELESQICGYETALKNHNIVNDVVAFNSEFREYLYANFEWSTCCGWADAITRNTQSPSEAVSKFFELANEYLLNSYGVAIELG
jgi:hypothetical protein